MVIRKRNEDIKLTTMNKELTVYEYNGKRLTKETITKVINRINDNLILLAMSVIKDELKCNMKDTLDTVVAVIDVHYKELTIGSDKLNAIIELMISKEAHKHLITNN